MPKGGYPHVEEAKITTVGGKKPNLSIETQESKMKHKVVSS
jgi:hypothetical protein